LRHELWHAHVLTVAPRPAAAAAAGRTIPQRVVAGTSLAAVAATGAVAGTVYWMGDAVDLPAAAFVSASALLAAPLGALATTKLNCQVRSGGAAGTSGGTPPRQGARVAAALPLACAASGITHHRCGARGIGSREWSLMRGPCFVRAHGRCSKRVRSVACAQQGACAPVPRCVAAPGTAPQCRGLRLAEPYTASVLRCVWVLTARPSTGTTATEASRVRRGHAVPRLGCLSMLQPEA
jgi:hypothetical protein